MDIFDGIHVDRDDWTPGYITAELEEEPHSGFKQLRLLWHYFDDDENTHLIEYTRPFPVPDDRFLIYEGYKKTICEFLGELRHVDRYDIRFTIFSYLDQGPLVLSDQIEAEVAQLMQQTHALSVNRATRHVHRYHLASLYRPREV